MRRVDNSDFMAQQIGQLIFLKKSKVLRVFIITDSIPLLDLIVSMRQIELKLLRNTMTDIKEKLKESSVSE